MEILFKLVKVGKFVNVSEYENGQVIVNLFLDS